MAQRMVDQNGEGWQVDGSHAHVRNWTTEFFQTWGDKGNPWHFSDVTSVAECAKRAILDRQGASEDTLAQALGTMTHHVAAEITRRLMGAAPVSEGEMFGVIGELVRDGFAALPKELLERVRDWRSLSELLCPDCGGRSGEPDPRAVQRAQEARARGEEPGPVQRPPRCGTCAGRGYVAARKSAAKATLGQVLSQGRPTDRRDPLEEQFYEQWRRGQMLHYWSEVLREWLAQGITVVGVEMPALLEATDDPKKKALWSALTIDLLLDVPDFGLVLTDLKSGKTAPSEGNLDIAAQLGHYSSAAKYGRVLVDGEWRALDEFPAAQGFVYLPAALPDGRASAKGDGTPRSAWQVLGEDLWRLRPYRQLCFMTQLGPTEASVTTAELTQRVRSARAGHYGSASRSDFDNHCGSCQHHEQCAVKTTRECLPTAAQVRKQAAADAKQDARLAELYADAAA